MITSTDGIQAIFKVICSKHGMAFCPKCGTRANYDNSSAFGTASTAEMPKKDSTTKKKKLRIGWLIAAAVIAVAIILSVFDYRSYREGQEYGVTMLYAAGSLAGTTIVHLNDTFQEQCNDVYDYLNRMEEQSHRSDITIRGQTIDNSSVRRSSSNVLSSIAGMMREGGYEPYRYGKLENWFKYTNYFSYITRRPEMICIIIAVGAGVAWTIIVRKKMEIG